jgi:hypothetical protein
VKTPDTSGIRSADRTCKKDIERGQVSRIGGIRSKQVVGRKSCSMERAMVSCETANGFRILKAVSELALLACEALCLDGLFTMVNCDVTKAL